MDKRVFVIMPFGSDFDDIYTGFIKPTLEAAGYYVFRADDLDHQQAIIRDIVNGLATADLIVADLTDSNPNVYYELGIAHGLTRPVILLRQDIDELPFDLRPYRVISYSTHFARIGEAREKLEDVARGRLRVGSPFGNPVSDYLPAAIVNSQATREAAPAPQTPEERDENEKGLLDHFVQLIEAMETLTTLSNANTESIEKITQETEAAGHRLSEAAKAASPESLRNQREIVQTW